MNTDNQDIKDILFLKGLKSFNESDFYDAHEYWEELWSDYILSDRKFIQGLIQLAVAYFHITNINKRGALSMLNKCQLKIEMFKPFTRGLDVNYILNSIRLSINNLNDIEDVRDFDWSLIPRLELSDERA